MEKTTAPTAHNALFGGHKRIQITLHNQFHGTTARIRVRPEGQYLSPRVIRRVGTRLCGMSACLCSLTGALGAQSLSSPSGWSALVINRARRDDIYVKLLPQEPQP